MALLSLCCRLREMELQDEIVQLVHDKELKASVASMKADAKARFAEVVDIVEDRKFWRKCKALVEYCGPIMNLLRMADSNIPGTGKVYHENFKLGKILQSMTDSPEFDFIPCNVCVDVQSKWMSLWTDLRYIVLGTALIWSFTPMTTQHVPRL